MANMRELAVDMLLEITEKDRYSHLVIREVLQKHDYLDGRDKAFLKRLTEGTLERKLQIDFVINQFSKVPVHKMKPFIRTLLRMSVYQLLFMDSVPDSAVCNEAVKLCKKRSFHSLQGFVNGVLRTIARSKDAVCYPDRDKDTAEFLSVFFSMPKWLVEKFIEEYGEEKTEKMLKAFLEAVPVTVRVCEETKAKELVGVWETEGIFAEQHPYLSYAYRLRGLEGISHLAGYEEGLFTVQDVSSMLVCEAANIRKGDRIIDVCAAPGGKAVHAAQKLAGSGMVSARDLTEYKASLIRDNIDRMQLSNCEVLVWDACKIREEDKETADIVIADLPCSGLGIMGKKKDIRYHASKDGLNELIALQREILKTVWQYVKPGGVLLYSTCTVNPGENRDNVEWFTANYPFETENLGAYLPGLEELCERDGTLQLIPGEHETDGFFIARLRRKS